MYVTVPVVKKGFCFFSQNSGWANGPPAHPLSLALHLDKIIYVRLQSKKFLPTSESRPPASAMLRRQKRLNASTHHFILTSFSCEEYIILLII